MTKMVYPWKCKNNQWVKTKKINFLRTISIWRKAGPMWWGPTSILPLSTSKPDNRLLQWTRTSRRLSPWIYECTQVLPHPSRTSTSSLALRTGLYSMCHKVLTISTTSTRVRAIITIIKIAAQTINSKCYIVRLPIQRCRLDHRWPQHQWLIYASTLQQARMETSLEALVRKLFSIVVDAAVSFPEMSSIKAVEMVTMCKPRLQRLQMTSHSQSCWPTRPL